MEITASDIRAGFRPTMADKIASVDSIEELTGFYNQLRLDGRLDDTATGLIATRKAELEKGK